MVSRSLERFDARSSVTKLKKKAGSIFKERGVALNSASLLYLASTEENIFVAETRCVLCSALKTDTSFADVIHQPVSISKDQRSRFFIIGSAFFFSRPWFVWVCATVFLSGAIRSVSKQTPLRVLQISSCKIECCAHAIVLAFFFLSHLSFFIAPTSCTHKHFTTVPCTTCCSLTCELNDVVQRSI